MAGQTATLLAVGAQRTNPLRGGRGGRAGVAAGRRRKGAGYNLDEQSPANTIFQVWPGGKIKVVAVLPPQKTKVTQEAADALGLPTCVVGKTYAFEAVPTDVEVTRSAHLVVSLLPGGPEDASLGACGAVVLVGRHGKVYELADGFLGAANVALAPHGKIYVSGLSGNRVSLLHHGKISTVAEVPSPAALEYSHGKLYASVDVLANGSIVTIRPKRGDAGTMRAAERVLGCPSATESQVNLT